MIVLKLEMWPRGDETKMYPLGMTVICNVGGHYNRHNYNVFVGRKKKTTFDSKDVIESPIRRGFVHRYPHMSYNVWRLVIRALKSAFPEEK